jgi:tetratricopeptide (TPR) repeat protein
MSVVECGEQGVLEALDAARHARLLVEEQSRHQFTHDVIREVVEADLGMARRMALHRRIGDVLERQAIRLGRELPVAILAYHYGRSDAEDKALPYLEQAGDMAQAQAAHRAADGYYRELVRRLDGLGLALDAARVREKLGEVLLTMAQLTAALEVFEQAAEVFRAAGDLERLGWVTSRIGIVHYNRGAPREGLARLQPIVVRLEAVGPSRSLAALYGALLHQYHLQGRLRDQLETATRSAEIAQIVGDIATVADAQTWRGCALMNMGRDEEGLPVLQEASRLAEGGGRFESLGLALSMLSWMYEDRGQLEQSRLDAARLLAAAERAGDPAAQINARIRLSAVAFFTGNWTLARDHIERAPTLPDSMPYFDAGSCLELGRLALAEGAWDEASRYLEECSSIARRVERVHIQDRVADSLLAERDVLEGCPERALARLLPHLDSDCMEEHEVTTYLLPTLAWAYLESGEIALALHTIETAIRQARASQYRLRLVDMLRILALVAIKQRLWEAAHQALEEGLSLARPMPYPHGEGRLLHVYGRMHLDRNEPTAARERLEAALAIFRRLGARKDIERALQDISNLQS